MPKDTQCSDCSNNVTVADKENQCKAPALQGALEPDYQKDQPSKAIPSETCRAVRILCGAEARWFVHK
jgi:hypothetical protein